MTKLTEKCKARWLDAAREDGIDPELAADAVVLVEWILARPEANGIPWADVAFLLALRAATDRVTALALAAERSGLTVDAVGNISVVVAQATDTSPSEN